MDMRVIEERCQDEKGSSEFELYLDFFSNVLEPLFKSEDIILGYESYIIHPKIYKHSFLQNQCLYDTLLNEVCCFDDIEYFFNRYFFYEPNDEDIYEEYKWLYFKTSAAAELFNNFIGTYLVGNYYSTDAFNKSFHKGVYIYQSGVYKAFDECIEELKDSAKELIEEA